MYFGSSYADHNISRSNENSHLNINAGYILFLCAVRTLNCPIIRFDRFIGFLNAIKNSRR